MSDTSPAQRLVDRESGQNHRMSFDWRSMDSWQRILSYLAVPGLVAAMIGLTLDIDWLVVSSLVLGAPLVLGGVVSVLLLPYAVWVVAKEKRYTERSDAVDSKASRPK